jgi:hypothetical protein
VRDFSYRPWKIGVIILLLHLWSPSPCILLFVAITQEPFNVLAAKPSYLSTFFELRRHRKNLLHILPQMSLVSEPIQQDDLLEFQIKDPYRPMYVMEAHWEN